MWNYNDARRTKHGRMVEEFVAMVTDKIVRYSGFGNFVYQILSTVSTTVKWH